MSHNVSEYGDYSVQVLTAALQIQGNFRVENYEKLTAAGEYVGGEYGFICHAENHWFTVRYVAGAWINLNSLEEWPSTISELILTQVSSLTNV